MPDTAATGDDAREAAQKSATLVERAMACIRADILTGALGPDTKLRIHELRARYGIGATPIREALSRLTSQGLVKAVVGRGFRVSPISRADLADIVAAREVIEIEALRRSMERGDDEWEAGIVAALYRLEKFTQRDPAEFQQWREEFDTAHKQFHSALVAACGSPRMLELHGALYDQAFRYRFLMMENLMRRPQKLSASHAELARLVLARDAGPACARLTRHLHSALEVIYPAQNIVPLPTAGAEPSRPLAARS